MKSTIFTFALPALAAGFAAAQATPHQSGGKEYVVILDKDHPTPPEVEAVLQQLELNTSHPDVRHVFNNSAFRGFAASMKSHCIDLLTNMTEVSVVEETVGVTHALALPKERRGTPYRYDTRANAPWGLQTISAASIPSNSNAKELNYTYSFANTDLGTGADIYVVDTGLYTEHIVFGGRAKQIWSFDGNSTVVDGHGTHTAGTAGGASLGVASNANVFGVRALSGDGTGWSSDVVAGINYVVQQHDLRKANASANGHRGSVMSISLAAGKVDSLRQAVNAAIQAGVHTVVAAGNEGQDACGTSPASSGGAAGPAITVGSVGISGKRSKFSNTGRCVDIYAPGEDIISAWLGAPDMVNVLSGTSMATPHVAGIVAYATANQTLANDTGLMKEWIRMQGQTNSEGIVVANNGVLASTSTTPHRRDVEKDETNEDSSSNLVDAGDRYVHARRDAGGSLTPTLKEVDNSAPHARRSVKSALQSAWEKVKGAFQSAWNSVKNSAEHTWDKIMAGADDHSGHFRKRSLKSWLKSAWDKLSNTSPQVFGIRPSPGKTWDEAIGPSNPPPTLPKGPTKRQDKDDASSLDSVQNLHKRSFKSWLKSLWDKLSNTSPQVFGIRPPPGETWDTAIGPSNPPPKLPKGPTKRQDKDHDSVQSLRKRSFKSWLKSLWDKLGNIPPSTFGIRPAIGDSTEDLDHEVPHYHNKRQNNDDAPVLDIDVQKRALGDGLNSLVAFFSNLFGGHKGKKHSRDVGRVVRRSVISEEPELKLEV